MKLLKPVKVLSIISIALSGTATLIALTLCMKSDVVLNLMAGRNYSSGSVFPWDVVIPLLVYTVINLAFVVLVNSLKTGGYRVTGIVFAIVILLNRFASLFMSPIANMVNASRGVEYIAAHSVMTSAVSLLTSPLSMVSSALLFFTCGMCIFVEYTR